jgi:hypothetical protein
MSLAATVQPQHLVQISGTVTDPNPASVNIAFSGAYTGSTTANSNGSFDLITANATLGTLTAVAIDGQGQTVTEQTGISVSAPVISALTLTYGSKKNVTVSGTVADIDKGGRTVTFSGALSGTVVTSADGSFSFSGQASNHGALTASTVDLWGQDSNAPQVIVAPNPPQINNFWATEGEGTQLNYWTFSGSVSDSCQVSGMTITFGGMPSLKGKTATVQADGTFSLLVQLQNGESGTASAVTQDWWGQASNTAMAAVNPT